MFTSLTPPVVPSTCLNGAFSLILHLGFPLIILYTDFEIWLLQLLHTHRLLSGFVEGAVLQFLLWWYETTTKQSFIEDRQRIESPLSFPSNKISICGSLILSWPRPSKYKHCYLTAFSSQHGFVVITLRVLLRDHFRRGSDLWMIVKYESVIKYMNMSSVLWHGFMSGL